MSGTASESGGASDSYSQDDGYTLDSGGNWDTTGASGWVSGGDNAHRSYAGSGTYGQEVGSATVGSGSFAQTIEGVTLNGNMWQSGYDDWTETYSDTNSLDNMGCVPVGQRLRHRRRGQQLLLLRQFLQRLVYRRQRLVQRQRRGGRLSQYVLQRERRLDPGQRKLEHDLRQRLLHRLRLRRLAVRRQRRVVQRDVQRRPQRRRRLVVQQRRGQLLRFRPGVHHFQRLPGVGRFHGPVGQHDHQPGRRKSNGLRRRGRFRLLGRRQLRLRRQLLRRRPVQLQLRPGQPTVGHARRVRLLPDRLVVGQRPAQPAGRQRRQQRGQRVDAVRRELLDIVVLRARPTPPAARPARTTHPPPPTTTRSAPPASTPQPITPVPASPPRPA